MVTTMIEVFKTNVNDPDQAKRLIETIHASFANVQANFDLDDCDKILRVKSTEDDIDPMAFTTLLGDWGFRAEVLQNDVAVDAQSQAAHSAH